PGARLRENPRFAAVFAGTLEPVDGIEPSTYGLRNRCSTTELHRRNLGTEVYPPAGGAASRRDFQVDRGDRRVAVDGVVAGHVVRDPDAVVQWPRGARRQHRLVQGDDAAAGGPRWRVTLAADVAPGH